MTPKIDRRTFLRGGAACTVAAPLSFGALAWFDWFFGPKRTIFDMGRARKKVLLESSTLVKPGDSTDFRMNVGDGYAVFDLATGTIKEHRGCTPVIMDAGYGWYHVSVCGKVGLSAKVNCEVGMGTTLWMPATEEPRLTTPPAPYTV